MDEMTAPDLGQIEQLAQTTIAALPRPFAFWPHKSPSR